MKGEMVEVAGQVEHKLEEREEMARRLVKDGGQQGALILTFAR